METTMPRNFNRQQIANLVSSMSREDIAWTIKFLTDKMLKQGAESLSIASEHPTWWNRPLASETEAMLPEIRQELGDDYKELLSEIIEEKYQ